MARQVTPLDHDHIQPHMCDLDLRLYILAHLPFFTDLPAAQFAEINKLFVDRGYGPGECLYFEGDPATHLYVVADGNVKLMRHTAGGKDVLLDFLASGEFFGSLTHAKGDTYAETARAHTQACILSIDGADFRAILSANPSVALKVMDIVSERLRSANEMVGLLSVVSIEQRLAQILLKLAGKFGEKSKTGLLIQLPLGRTDLAEMTGTTTETASRVLSQFQKDGLIHTGRRWVAITDPQGLADLTFTRFV